LSSAAPRIHAEVVATGTRVSRKRVARLSLVAFVLNQVTCRIGDLPCHGLPQESQTGWEQFCRHASRGEKSDYKQSSLGYRIDGTYRWAQLEDDLRNTLKAVTFDG
jgi:hypothetical protein